MGSLGDPAISNTGGVGRCPKDMLDTYDLIPILSRSAAQRLAAPSSDSAEFVTEPAAQSRASP